MAVETAMMAGDDDFRTGPHGVSKLTLKRQWAGGGAGSDAADGGVAEKRPIAVRGCTDGRERRAGERARPWNQLWSNN